MRNTILLLISLIFLFTTLNGETIQDFTLPDTNNQNISLSEYLDTGPVVLDFWASWCAPCMRLLPELEKIHNEYEEVNVVTVSIDNPRSVSRAKSLIRSQRYSFVALFDTNHEVMKRFQVTTVPHTFLISPEGIILYEHTGYARGDEEELISEIEKFLADPPEHEKQIPYTDQGEQPEEK